jgi:hypothetical protein
MPRILSSRTLRNPLVWCGALIFALAVSLYVQTARFDYLEWDDQLYVSRNTHVLRGLSADSILWAFTDTARKTCNWHPLTFLSHMADVTFFGVDPGPMHLHNAVLHGVDSVLLFAFLVMLIKRLSGGGGFGKTALPDAAGPISEIRAIRSSLPLPSLFAALVATLFWSLHPLRVESVAWIASRKDVLCLFWYLVGSMVYLSGLHRDRNDVATDRGGAARLRDREDFGWRPCAVAVLYLFAFMSKPTAIVFPATAMLLEYAVTRRITWRRNELMVYLAPILGTVTVFVQDIGLALDPGTLPLANRLPNAVSAIGQYVSTTIWPHNLACFYPYEWPVPYRRMIPACIFLVLLAEFLLRHLWPFVRAHPVAAWQCRIVKPAAWNHDDARAQMVLGCGVGLLWFVIALLPVLGLLQVGIAACADRYNHLAGVGFSILLAVVMTRAREWRPRAHVVLAVGMSAVSAVLYAVSYRQVGVWRNQFTVFSHAAKAVKGNHLAECNVGVTLLEEHRCQEALPHLLEAAKALLTEQYTHNLAAVLSRMAGDKSITDVLKRPVAADDPQASMKYHALGLIASYRNLDTSAESFLRKSAELDPREYHVWQQLGFLCERQGRMREAEEMFAKASALNPSERGLRAKLKQIRKQNRTSGG